jgi:hypothetical protein
MLSLSGLSFLFIALGRSRQYDGFKVIVKYLISELEIVSSLSRVGLWGFLLVELSKVVYEFVRVNCDLVHLCVVVR